MKPSKNILQNSLLACTSAAIMLMSILKLPAGFVNNKYRRKIENEYQYTNQYGDLLQVFSTSIKVYIYMNNEIFFNILLSVP